MQLFKLRQMLNLRDEYLGVFFVFSVLQVHL